jgi:hypothetical protein
MHRSPPNYESSLTKAPGRHLGSSAYAGPHTLW